MRALAPVALLLLALLLASGAAEARHPGSGVREVTLHTVEFRLLDGSAQVVEHADHRGGLFADFRVPAQARDVQAFNLADGDARAVPWRWIEPGLLRLDLWNGSIAGDPDTANRGGLRVLYTVPVPPSGFRHAWSPTVPTEVLVITVLVPEAWQATDGEGRPLAPAGPGPGAFGLTRTGLDAGAQVPVVVAPVTGPSPLFVIGGLLALVFAGTMVRAVTARGKPVKEAMGLLDHLRELSTRLRSVVVVVAALMLLLFTFALEPAQLAGVQLALPAFSLTDNIAAQTFRMVSQQFVPPGVEVVVVNPVGGALVQLEVALFLAFLVASPLIGYELGAFLMPALLPRERGILLRAIPVVTLLFVVGALFAYTLMVPTMMRVLYAYAEGLGARSFLMVESLVSFAIIVTLMFGIAFELPVVMTVLAKLGLVSPRTMAAKWRHAIVGIFVLAAVITPDPTIVSQVMVAVPLLALYGTGVVAARAVAPEEAPAEPA